MRCSNRSVMSSTGSRSCSSPRSRRCSPTASVRTMSSSRTSFHTYGAGCASRQPRSRPTARSPPASSPTSCPTSPRTAILRAGLELLATQRLLPGLRARVEQLLAGFQRVAFIRPAAGQLPSFQITRLNRHYQPALELCRLLFDQAGASLDVGVTRGSRLLLPDGDGVPGSGDHTPAQATAEGFAPARAERTSPPQGTPQRPLTFAADIVIGSPPRLVVDTKYAAPEIRTNTEGGRFTTTTSTRLSSTG